MRQSVRRKFMPTSRTNNKPINAQMKPWRPHNAKPTPPKNSPPPRNNVPTLPPGRRNIPQIAESSTGKGGWSINVAVGYASSLEADNSALSKCNANISSTCSIVHRWQGAGCAAIAKKANKGGGAWATANSKSAAEQSALNTCGGNCTVIDSGCVY